MNRHVIACLCAASALLHADGTAHAAIWAWGCQGQLKAPDEQVIFNRFSMFIVDGRGRFSDLRKLVPDNIDDLIKGASERYEPDNVNGGLEQTMQFVRKDDPKAKVILTELSSRRLTHRTRVVCGRDDITDTFRKVYRLERVNEPPRTITMQCVEYTLSTRGGRKGCD